jgi:hypothetical protein
MFTKGQVARMVAALNSTVAGRNNLWDSTNLNYTGAFADRPDLKPIPEFAIVPATTGSSNYLTYMDRLAYFTFPGNNVKFVNKSWNDTITSITWTFSGGAETATSTTTATVNAAITNNFSASGWVDVKLSASGNNSGESSIENPRALFVADASGISGTGYIQEFSGADTAKWPMFNYYNNEFKWQINDTIGAFDNSCVQYVGFDSRNGAYTGTPNGDVDDFFTQPFDLSGFSEPNLYMNFLSSGASRSNLSINVNDTLEIAYSANKSNNWTKIGTFAKHQLCNKGGVATSYFPHTIADWVPNGVSLPSGARGSYTVFRFRYRPNVSDPSYGIYSTGNNFFLDKLNFSPFPAEVGNVKLGSVDVAVVPNPTKGDAYVVVKDADNTSAQIIVTDITGKTVYTATQNIVNGQAYIQVPHNAISVQGMYMVQTITGNQARTSKLVVY